MQEILSKKDIAERLKLLRAENQLSQGQIAHAIGISRSNYSQIELGKQFPTYEALVRIARYYSKSYEWILSGFENNHVSRLEQLIGNLELQIKKLNLSIVSLQAEVEKLKGFSIDGVKKDWVK